MYLCLRQGHYFHFRFCPRASFLHPTFRNPRLLEEKRPWLLSRWSFVCIARLRKKAVFISIWNIDWRGDVVDDGGGVFLTSSHENQPHQDPASYDTSMLSLRIQIPDCRAKEECKCKRISHKNVGIWEDICHSLCEIVIKFCGERYQYITCDSKNALT